MCWWWICLMNLIIVDGKWWIWWIYDEHNNIWRIGLYMVTTMIWRRKIIGKKACTDNKYMMNVTLMIMMTTTMMVMVMMACRNMMIVWLMCAINYTTFYWMIFITTALYVWDWKLQSGYALNTYLWQRQCYHFWCIITHNI